MYVHNYIDINNSFSYIYYKNSSMCYITLALCWCANWFIQYVHLYSIMATIYNQSDSNKLHVANIIKYNYGLKNSFTMCRSCTNSIVMVNL